MSCIVYGSNTKDLIRLKCIGVSSIEDITWVPNASYTHGDLLQTKDCTVLFISLKVTTVDNLSYIQTVVYSISAAIGFWLAMIMVAAIYEKLDLIGKVPKGLQGPGIIMIITGIMALAFMGFSGMV